MKNTSKLLRKTIVALESGDNVRLGDLARRLLKGHPDSPEALNLLGVAELRLDRPAHAVKVFERLTSISMRDAMAHYNLGLARYRSRLHEAAIAAFQRALDLDPELGQAYTVLALCLKDFGRVEDAIVPAEQACVLQPFNGAYQNNLGVVYEEYGLFEKAADKYRIACELAPSHPVYLKNYGLALLGRGMGGEAEQCFRKALNQAPEFGEAWRHLVVTKKYSDVGDGDLQKLEALSEKKGLPRATQIDVLFALGKIYDDLGRCHEAFQVVQRANAMERDVFNFKPQRLPEKYRLLGEAFRDVCFDDRRFDLRGDLPVPIFIVGLPRSGTSLVEHMLAEHPDIFASGERTWLNHLERRLPELVDSNRPYPLCVKDMDSDLSGRLANEYLAYLQNISDGSHYVIDKLPENFERLGLIGVLFPQAVIIHCSRARFDVCMSMYFLRFPGAIHYSYDLDHLAAYCAFHQHVMDLWRGCFSGRIVELNYESIVQEPLVEKQRLFEAIGLSYDPAEPAGPAGKRWIRTASDHQVHGEIYQTSHGRWKRYEVYRTGIEDAVVRYGAEYE